MKTRLIPDQHTVELRIEYLKKAEEAAQLDDLKTAIKYYQKAIDIYP